MSQPLTQNLKSVLLAPSRWLALPLMIGGLLLATSPSHAVVVYKSIGVHGEVKYSQHPPRDARTVEAIEFRSDGRQVNAGEMAGRTEATQPPEAQFNQDQRVAQLEQRLKEQENQANAQRCQSLRNNLTNLNVGGRIYEQDDAGNRKYLDNREIEIRRDRIQQAINQYCTGQSI